MNDLQRETPEAAGRRLLGEALYQRLARHLAPPLLEDLCQCVAMARKTEPSEPQIQAMGALFDFCQAVNKGHLTVDDLRAEMELAVEAGHDMMELNLAMASLALRLARRTR